ncbi:MAG: DegT/DnrJ/EryC1/StrS family aminotransferase [Pseudomonadales bacterium]
MNVPLLDLDAQLQTVGEDVRAGIESVIQSGRFINGPEVSSLESQIADYCGVKQAIGVSSGTDALLVSLMALGIGTGDLVLTTPYSFFATAGAVARLGATPVFVDVQADSYNLCPEQLAQWFLANRESIPSVKAVIVVHLYGQCADMSPILELANAYGVPVIEDAAQAIGARYEHGGEQMSAGSMGDIGCFSFFPSKNLGAMGDGGMVVTQSEKTGELIRKLRNHGASPKYYHQLIGGNFRLDTIQAAVLCAKFPHLQDWHAARQKNAAYYDEQLGELVAVVTPKVAQSRAFHIYNQYVVHVSERDELRAHLQANQIGTEIYYPVPFHLQECFKELGHRRGDFPVAESAADNSLALPIYPELDVSAQAYVVEKIREFYA